MPGEAWHIEVPRTDLELLARKVSDPLIAYPAKERRWIRAYDKLVHQKRAGRDSAEASQARVRLRQLMTARRKAIWRVAQETGWTTHNRGARYRSLMTRTR